MPGYGGIFAAPSFARDKADADAPVGLKGDIETATQHISYGSLAGSPGSAPSAVAGEDENAAPPRAGDVSTEHLVYPREETRETGDLLESLPPEADKGVVDS